MWDGEKFVYDLRFLRLLLAKRLPLRLSQRIWPGVENAAAGS